MPSIRRPPATTRVTTPRSTPKAAIVKLSDVKVGDTGLKTKFDARTQTLTISGTARGIETRSPGDRTSTFAERERTPDYLKTEQFGGGISLSFDKDKMPAFDTSRGYTEKNAWYFAHGASVGTKRGQTPKQVAETLAAKVNENRDYRATVKANPDGSASLSVSRRE